MIVVGAGLAGARAVETMRAEGFDGRIVLVGDEPVRPYERPPLSKGLLQGSTEAAEAFVHSEDWYAAANVELRTSTLATGLRPDAREIELDTGEQLHYDRLLLATGSSARPLTVPGADLAGVHLLRSLADGEALAGALKSSPRVVVIGSGWIGTEVAASARAAGCEVTLVGRGSAPLERILGPEVGAVFRDLHSDHGVRLMMGVGVESLRGAGRVEEVHTADGRVIPCDLVVAGVGAIPRTELAESAGMTIKHGGVATDQCLHTSANWVYAAGDVAAAWHPLFRSRVRVEHWANAGNQGPVAARNMLGRGVVYDRVPYFFSDQFELGMEYSGYAPKWDEIVFRGDPHRREFIAFYLREGRVVAGMNANVWDVVGSIQNLVRSERVVDPAILADSDASLEAVEEAAA
jgi:3-phenylpropionate/trans-cinnamate dioxygenase ferredoxin reductase subunit